MWEPCTAADIDHCIAMEDTAWWQEEEEYWFLRATYAQNALTHFEGLIAEIDPSDDRWEGWQAEIADKRIDIEAFHRNAKQAHKAERILWALRRVCREEKNALA